MLLAAGAGAHVPERRAKADVMDLLRRPRPCRADPGLVRRLRPQLLQQPSPDVAEQIVHRDYAARWPAPAWTSHLHPRASATSLARCRTSSRSSRMGGGATHASGSRPIPQQIGRSAASRDQDRRGDLETLAALPG